MSEKFCKRWADRFMEIRDRDGRSAAGNWASRFLNREDIKRVRKYVRERNVA